MEQRVAEDLLVSVIVPVRNAGRYLPDFIVALSRQTLARERFEVVLADDGSTDGSTLGIETADGWLRVIRGPERNAYAARNCALRASRAPVVAFIDADCLPAPDWLAEGLSAVRNAEIAAGLIRFRLGDRRTVWTLMDIDSTKNHELQVRLGTAETANLFVRRDVIDRFGDFDDHQPGYGDFEFVSRCVASGARLVYAPRAVVTHPTRDRGRSFLGNVWSMNSSYAAFETRAGRRPEGLKLRAWVPIASTLRARRRFGQSVGPDRRPLEASGVRLRPMESLIALPVIYLVIPYVRALGQLRGWWVGRRERRHALAASALDSHS